MFLSNLTHPAWRRAVPALLALGLAAVASAQLAAQPGEAPEQRRQAQEHVYPGAEWDRWPLPESAGFSSERMQDVLAYVERMRTTGLVVVQGGKILFEYGDIRDTSYIASVRKSVLSILYGMYVERGAIDLSKTLADLGIDDLQGLTDGEKRATIDHIINARSGVYHPASNAGDSLGRAPERGSKEPGEFYLYSNWDFNVAGTIFEQLTGKGIYDALEEDLAKPIQLQDFNRASHRRSGNANRSMHMAYHMNISARDLARIGYLMLREGNWNGNQLVSREWVRHSTTPVSRYHEVTGRNGNRGYGYMWWIWDGPNVNDPYEGAYTGSGAGGQYVTVIPKLDLVVGHKTNTRVAGQGSGSYFTLLNRIIAAKAD